MAASRRSGIRVAAAVPPLDLSKLQSIITMHQLHASAKNPRYQIPWPPRVPHAPNLLQRPSPAGPTPAIGASRGSESERPVRPKALDSASGVDSSLAPYNLEVGARPKVALVVLQGMEVQKKPTNTNFESLDGSARDLHDECLPVVPPVGVSFSEGRPLLQHHDVNVISSHRANNPPKSTEFLYAIEVRMPCFSCIFFIQHWSF